MSETYLQSFSWSEVAEPHDEYQTQQHLCHGYDVYGDMLTNADIYDLKLLLLLGKPPKPEQKKLLSLLEFCLANFGPREASIRAAMNAGVGGSAPASALMASLAISSGNILGTNELQYLMNNWLEADEKYDSWLIKRTNQTQAEILPDIEHIPGFEVTSQHTGLPVKQALKVLATVSCAKKIRYLNSHFHLLTLDYQRGLTMIAIAACVYLDLGLSITQAQYHFLQAKLIGAAHHANEQAILGWKNFPFAKTVQLIGDPGFKGLPDMEVLKP